MSYVGNETFHTLTVSSAVPMSAYLYMKKLFCSIESMQVVFVMHEPTTRTVWLLCSPSLWQQDITL